MFDNVNVADVEGVDTNTVRVYGCFGGFASHLPECGDVPGVGVGEDAVDVDGVGVALFDVCFDTDTVAWGEVCEGGWAALGVVGHDGFVFLFGL